VGGAAASAGEFNRPIAESMNQFKNHQSPIDNDS
jgi:hypothetical protein